MSAIAEVQQNIVDFETAQYITGALRDISAMELKRYRDKFEHNVALFRELEDLYVLITRIAQHEGRTEVAKVSAERLYVGYTTNRHFYGNLNRDVIQALAKSTSRDDRCLIIGATGRELWASLGLRRREVSYIAFADDTPDASEIKDFLERVAPYGHVHIFYPSFVSVFQQQAISVDITFNSEKTKNAAHEELPQYILEPEIVEMFSFFDTQVRTVLFERLLLETQLSRVAARLMKMDTADENAGNLLARERRHLRRALSDSANIRLLESFTGYLQWKQKKVHIAR